MKVLKPICKQEVVTTKVLSLRIPQSLHNRIQQVTEQAKAAGYLFSATDIAIDSLESGCRAAEKMLTTIPATISKA